MAALSALLLGLLFGAGLIVAGMTDPARILAFLDVAGDWNPSLALVMAGAIAVAAPAFAWIRRRPLSLLGGRGHAARPAQDHLATDPRRGDFRLGLGPFRYLPGAGPGSIGAGRDRRLAVCRRAGRRLLGRNMGRGQSRRGQGQLKTTIFLDFISKRGGSMTGHQKTAALVDTDWLETHLGSPACGWSTPPGIIHRRDGRAMPIIWPPIFPVRFVSTSTKLPMSRDRCRIC